MRAFVHALLNDGELSNQVIFHSCVGMENTSQLTTFEALGFKPHFLTLRNDQLNMDLFLCKTKCCYL